jgi:RimJ/RimL family protein N-acetyltransferase
MEKVMDLHLEPLSESHLPLVMQWVNDREVMQYFASHQSTITEEAEREYIRSLLASGNDCVYSIFDGDTYVGQCSLNAIYRPARHARLFVVILKKHQGRGYGPAAIRTLLNIARDQLRLHKVWLIVRKDNLSAQAKYLKLGFEFEGVLRDEYAVGGRYYDMVRMGNIIE